MTLQVLFGTRFRYHYYQCFLGSPQNHTIFACKSNKHLQISSVFSISNLLWKNYIQYNAQVGIYNILCIYSIIHPGLKTNNYCHALIRISKLFLYPISASICWHSSRLPEVYHRGHCELYY